MFQIRWHARAGQGAITGAKGLADVISKTGKEVQAFASYGSAKRGAAMMAYNRIDDEPILNHERFMQPDYVLVIDPGLVFIENIFANEKEDTTYIITSYLNKEELFEKKPELKTRKVFLVDCLKISMEILKRPIPNTPMLGALMKVSGMLEIEAFKEAFKKVLGKKLTQEVIDANMLAIQRAYEEVQ